MLGVQGGMRAGTCRSWFSPVVRSSYGVHCGFVLYYARCSQGNGEAGREVHFGDKEGTGRGTPGVSNAKGGVPGAPSFGLYCAPLDQGGQLARVQGGPRMAH